MRQSLERLSTGNEKCINLFEVREKLKKTDYNTCTPEHVSIQICSLLVNP